jgi:hypothetical protein
MAPAYSNVTAGSFFSVLSPTDNFAVNKADKNKVNTFSNNNQFNKLIGVRKGTDVNISLSASIASKTIAIANDGNFFFVTDTVPYGILEKIKTPSPFGTGSSPFIWLWFNAPCVLKHAAAIDGTDAAAGHTSIYSISLSDATINAKDIVQLMLVGTNWMIINIFRPQDVIDPILLQDHPITVADLSCIVPADNTLGSLLQAMINTICSMSTKSQYAFIAALTADDSNPPTESTLVVGSANNIKPILFDNKLTAPYFDNGNDFYIDRYVCPDDNMPPQKFIVENLKFTHAGAGGYADALTVRIIKLDSSGNYIADIGISAPVSITGTSADHYVASVISAYVSLLKSEIVCVVHNRTHLGGAGDITKIFAACRFSNSFQ